MQRDTDTGDIVRARPFTIAGSTEIAFLLQSHSFQFYDNEGNITGKKDLHPQIIGYVTTSRDVDCEAFLGWQLLSSET